MAEQNKWGERLILDGDRRMFLGQMTREEAVAYLAARPAREHRKQLEKWAQAAIQEPRSDCSLEGLDWAAGEHVL